MTDLSKGGLAKGEYDETVERLKRMATNMPDIKADLCSVHNLPRESGRIGDALIYECSECIKNGQVEHALKKSKIPRRFKAKTIENYVVQTDGQKRAMAHVQWFLGCWRESTGLLMLGNPGTGKNHLTAGIAVKVIEDGGSVVFTEAIKIFREVKESWRSKDATEKEVLDRYIKPDLLIIDEVGVQFGSDTEKMLITEIINDRYNDMKPTILSGNLKVEALAQVVGERVVDRFRENGKAVVFDWTSYRSSAR